MDTAQLGIRLVKGELERRGLAVSESNEGRRQILTADGPAGRRLIKVSTRTGGTWQTSIDYGEKPAPAEYGNRLWIFVDLSKAAPSFYVVPYRWMSEDIYASIRRRCRAGLMANAPVTRKNRAYHSPLLHADRSTRSESLPHHSTRV